MINQKELKLSIMQAGYCTHKEHIVIRGGRKQDVEFPAMFALIEHPQFGLSLFDTGYSDAFFEATQAFPYSIYAKTTPVFLEESQLATAQLRQRGVEVKDIERIFISHFHADHIAALTAFPNAEFICFPNAFQSIKGKTGLAALRKAFVPDLLPKTFEERSKLLDLSRIKALPPEYHPFKVGIDVFADETVIAVELPGHAAGQLGLFVQTGQTAYFLVADACWLERSYKENILPSRITNLIFDDPKAYKETLTNIHDFHFAHSSVQIVPSHCQATLDRLIQK